MVKPATVIPIADLEHDAVSILRRVRESKEPTVITQEGRPEAVILSIDAYEQSQAERALLTRLAQGEQEIAHGEGYDLEDVLDEVDSLLLRPPE